MDDYDVRWSLSTPVSGYSNLVAHWIIHSDDRFNGDAVNKTNDADTMFMLSISVLVVALVSIAVITQRR